MIQLILHLWGDYLLQSGWMANNKTKHWLPALAHATVYSLPFLLIGSWKAVVAIWATHYLIDRYRLARYLCWFKNYLGPGNRPWSECSVTGYPATTPDWLAFWLMIIADNTLHLTINYVSLSHL